MNAFIILAVVAMTSPLVMCYDAKYDQLDIEKIIADETLFNSYIDCMLGRGPCTVEHSEDFKNLLPEVIQTACAKCSPIQKKNVRLSVKALQERKPADFKILREKVDPKGEYEKAFSEFLVGTN